MDDRLIGYTPRGTAVWRIRGGDGTDDDPPDPPSGEPGAPPALDISQVPEAIRNSPEYRELVRTNRSLSRSVGDAARREAAARGELEQHRQAAEAERTAQLEQQVQTILGDEGVAVWGELSELAATDPVAAATRMAELIAARAQSPAPGSTVPGTAPTTPPAAGSAAVPAQTPPPPSGRVDGSAPIGAASVGEDIDAVIAASTADYQEVVKRNNDPLLSNRVTMRERGKGFMSYLAASYLKSGATPKPKPEPRA